MNNYLGKKIDLRFFSYIKVIISNNMSSTNTLRDKISAWLSDRTNDENDLVDFLVNECGCVVDCKIIEKEYDNDNEQCNDCKIEAKKHCDVCGGYGGGSEDEE